MDQTKAVTVEAESAVYEMKENCSTILCFYDGDDELVAVFHDWDYARKIEDDDTEPEPVYTSHD